MFCVQCTLDWPDGRAVEIGRGRLGGVGENVWGHLSEASIKACSLSTIVSAVWVGVSFRVTQGGTTNRGGGGAIPRGAVKIARARFIKNC